MTSIELELEKSLNVENVNKSNKISTSGKILIGLSGDETLVINSQYQKESLYQQKLCCF